MLRRFVFLSVFGFSGLSAQGSWSVVGNPPIAGNEPSYAISSSEPAREYLAFNTHALYSRLKGAVDFEPLVFQTPYGYYGDPVLAPAPDGGMFLAHLAKNPEAEWPDFFNRMVVERFNSFGQHVQSVATPIRGSKMQDKPWICVNQNPQSSDFGALYLTWTEFDHYGSDAPGDSSRICFARLGPGAISFDSLVIVSDRCGNALDDDGTAEGATIGILPNDVLLCIWAQDDGIWQDRSFDLGRTWQRDTAIALQVGGWNHDGFQGAMRVNGMPFLAVGPRGQVAVVFTEGEAGSRRLVGLRSSDEGHSYRRIEGLAEGENFAPQIAWRKGAWHPRILVHSTSGFSTHRFFHVHSLTLKKKRFAQDRVLSEEPTLLPGNSYFMGDYASWQSQGREWYGAYTHFYAPKSRPCIAVFVAPNRLRNHAYLQRSGPRLQVHQAPDSSHIFVYAAWPEKHSCTLELEQGGKKWQQVIEELPREGIDLQWPCGSMDSGPVLVRLRSGGDYITENLLIRR